MRFSYLLMVSLLACTPSQSSNTDAAVASDAGRDAGPARAADYCESSVEMFCGFYLRCGRMAVSDVSECRAVFLETCNARYEPRYVMLEQAGMLRLSSEGIRTCAAHLADVPCEQQIRDLDGDCAALWEGTQPAGAPCGLDVESLVCGAGTTCGLDLSFCGQCRPLAVAGEACGDGVSCGADAQCSDGICVTRALPGQGCADGGRCVVGASCVADVCRGPQYVGVGESCGASRRCAYKSQCVGGTCVESALLGGSCDAETSCASGRCEAGECMPLKELGASCAASLECASANCVDGECTAIPGRCFADGGS